MFSTYGPTPNHERSMALAEQQFAEIRGRFNRMLEEAIPAFEARLEAAGAPWTPGQSIPEGP